ncbi:YbaB/EbfC family DNA-binding protein [Rhodococcus kronopolitis]|uniref:YbaB/EbfC family DNA-binding protein n=1 Tax=Rhodococcus kronopolitis TaxID=1460226 RepID=A0ABV9FLD2_9NOCA
MSAAEMDRVLADATGRVEALEAALHGLTRLRARLTHPSGVLSVEVDENGGLCGLWISEALDRVDAAELGRALTETADRAAEMVAGQRDRILASLHDALTH